MKSKFFSKLLNHISDYSNNKNSIFITKEGMNELISIPLSSSYISLLKSIFIFFKKDILTLILLGSILSFITLLISMMSGYIFSHIYEVDKVSHTIIFISFFFFLLGGSGLYYGNNMIVKTLTMKVGLSLSMALWDHFFQLSSQSAKKIVSINMAQRIFDYERALSIVLTTSFSIFFGLLSLLCLLGYMFYLHIILAFIYMGICLFILTIKISFFPANIHYLSGQLIEKGELSSFLNESLLQIQKIRSANIENIIFKKWLKKLISYKLYEEKSTHIEILSWLMDYILPIGLLLSCYGVLYFFSEKINSYIFLQFIICSNQFSGVFSKVSEEIISFIHHLPNFKRVRSIIDQNIEVEEVGIISNHFEGNIDFSKVSMKDSETGRFILEDISFQINSGEFIALIGQSGSGKSSILRLLLGLESIHSGRISIDGEDIQYLNKKSLRKQFGVVLQTTHIFPGTIFSNISTHTSLTLNEAWDLAKFVGLDKEINDMPMKMSTYISDNAGESISGGQKQKILLARALADRPRILLLDEATSALDNKNQAHIFQNLKSLNITRIVVSHRPSTILDADKIYQVHNGRIIRSGTYQQLFK